MLRRTVLATGLGSLLASALAKTAHAGPALGNGPTITLSPEAPTASDSVVVGTHYVGSDGCYHFKAYQLRVDEVKRVIRLELRYGHSGEICTQALVDIDRDIPLPRLLPGEWTLEVHSKLNHKKFPSETIPFLVLGA